MTTKVCTHCGVEKDITEFTVNKSVKSGYGGHCKPCHNIKNMVHHHARKKDSDYRAATLLSAAKCRCDNVTITKKWIMDKIENGVCEATGIKFDMEASIPARPFTPSLDRIDPKMGYTKDNVQVVCWIYNRAKGVGSHADVLTLVEALHERKEAA